MPVRTANLCRRVFSVVALCGVMLLSGATAAPSAPPAAVKAGDAVAQRYYPEVRLRKLHLVRPDLIPFPIDFDVFC